MHLKQNQYRLCSQGTNTSNKKQSYRLKNQVKCYISSSVGYSCYFILRVMRYIFILYSCTLYRTKLVIFMIKIIHLYISYTMVVPK